MKGSLVHKFDEYKVPPKRPFKPHTNLGYSAIGDSLLDRLPISLDHLNSKIYKFILH